MLKNCIVKTRENKVFDNGTMDGLVVCAIEGTQTFNSEKKKMWELPYYYKRTKMNIETTIEAVICLIFLVSNYLVLFYCRRIRKSLNTRIELIRQLYKGLYLMKYRTELIQ